MAEAFLERARAHLAAGRQEEALQSLDNALQREREFPNVKTQAWSCYTLLVAQQKLDHLYDSALKVLRENPIKAVSFPVDGFLWNATFALIADARGLRDQAVQCAGKALRFADLTQSGFRYHPDVGLVGSDYGNIKRELHRILQS
jgi:tetratricopeptide (TPR) repeat protein